jgi:type II secretion system protein G
MTLQTGKKGFTLMELMVVTGIIIVIAATVLTVLPGLREKTQKKATKAFIERLEIALEQYYNDNRSYPSTGITSLLTALQPSDPTVKLYAKHYIEFNDSEVDGNEIVDYWGNPFVYESLSPIHNTTTYDLYSKGPDGITSDLPDNGDDADDINNWSR